MLICDEGYCVIDAKENEVLRGVYIRVWEGGG